MPLFVFFGDDADSEEYENGVGVDPIGGVEAVISHYLSSELFVPTAHAPAFFDVEISTSISNPKVASENISSTYLPCVIQGLNRAPLISKVNGEISYKDVEALIAPYLALGSPAVLAAYQNGVKICAVKNDTLTRIGCNELNLNDIIIHDSYEDCLKALIKELL